MLGEGAWIQVDHTSYLLIVGGPWSHHITALLTVTKDNARFTDVLSISAKVKGHLRRCEI